MVRAACLIKSITRSVRWVLNLRHGRIISHAGRHVKDKDNVSGNMVHVAYRRIGRHYFDEQSLFGGHRVQLDWTTAESGGAASSETGCACRSGILCVVWHQLTCLADQSPVVAEHEALHWLQGLDTIFRVGAIYSRFFSDLWPNRPNEGQRSKNLETHNVGDDGGAMDHILRGRGLPCYGPSRAEKRLVLPIFT
ncbi:hypothetical protein E4U19_004278 [Claviceps sp. Clav32 group G5]|nr:hypothetical protein E4U19_004278 [Claviceps sp. Clav32 group G5]